MLRIGLIEAESGAEYDLALYFVLQGFGALEPFGTNERYVRFLQGHAAPVLRGLAGADVRLEDDFPTDAAPNAACLCLAAPFQTYDWEVSAALQTWRDGLDRTASVSDSLLASVGGIEGSLSPSTTQRYPTRRRYARRSVRLLSRAGRGPFVRMPRIQHMRELPGWVFVPDHHGRRLVGRRRTMGAGLEGRSTARGRSAPASLILPPGTSLANLKEGTVNDVIDGDTIDVSIDGKVVRIRYYGVDTPERGDKCYREATDRNRHLVADKVLLLPDARDKDTYDRTLRYVFRPDGTSVDATLVSEGFGHAWRQDGRYKQDILGLEDAGADAEPRLFVEDSPT